MPVIEVNHLTKEYRLGALQGLRQTLLNTGARLIGKQVEEPPLFKALDDVDFSIEQGEVVGIIGHNGAGKSTLLKMLARISTPSSGSVKVNGRIAPLIEVGAGFVPDFTGRENVYLNGAILGMSKQEVSKKFDEIVDFAEMAEFIDTPVKRYSSGMQVKLAFAVATSVESEILIVDEVLAVGDLAFQRKCFDRMENMIKQQGKTVLVVSHNIRQIQRLSKRVILLDHGKILTDGSPEPVCNKFYELSDKQIAASRSAGPNKSIKSSGEVDLLDIDLIDDQGHTTDTAICGDTVTIRIRLNIKSTLIEPVISVGVHTTDFLYLATHGKKLAPKLTPGTHTVFFKILDFPFLPRSYALRIGINAGEYSTPVLYGENLRTFTIEHPHINRVDAGEGFVRLSCEWQLAD